MVRAAKARLEAAIRIAALANFWMLNRGNFSIRTDVRLKREILALDMHNLDRMQWQVRVCGLADACDFQRCS